MKLLKSMVVAVSLLAVANVAMAEKIGVVDPQKIAAQSAEMKQLSSQLEKKFDSRRQELVKLQQQLQQDNEKLKRDAAILSAKEKTDLNNRIMEANKQLERKGRDFQQDVGMAQNQAVQQFKQKVNQAIEKVAKKEGYDLVIFKEAAPFSSNKYDLTAQVIKALN